VVFVSSLPTVAQPIAWALPLSHPVVLPGHCAPAVFTRASSTLYIPVLIMVTGYFAVRRLRKRLVQ
jgi:hypothetical protein